MKRNYYAANPDDLTTLDLFVPRLDLRLATDPSGYVPDEGLVDAVNVSLCLRPPFLVTGEPGTGKTQLAWSLAYQLGRPEPLIFETKSTSLAKDLFYTFDNIRRF